MNKKETIIKSVDPTDHIWAPINGSVDIEIPGYSLQRIRKLKKHLDKLLGFEPTAAQVIDYMIQIHENVFENMNKKKRGGRK
jgi:hypothetical protein